VKVGTKNILLAQDDQAPQASSGNDRNEKPTARLGGRGLAVDSVPGRPAL